MNYIGALYNEKFSYYYAGKIVSELLFLFSKISNGTFIHTFFRRLFGATLQYRRDVVTSGEPDLNLYLSDQLKYPNEAASSYVPRSHQLTLIGDNVHYDSYSWGLNLPYDTAYLNINDKSFSGIKKRDVARRSLYQRNVIHFLSHLESEKGMALVLGLLQQTPRKRSHSITFQGPSRAVCSKKCQSLHTIQITRCCFAWSQFFQVVSQKVPTYRYFNFKKYEETSPTT